MILKMFAAVMFLTFYYTSKSQEIKALEIGDKVPDVILKNMRNYKSQSGNLYDFKGKYLILDFWNKGCAPCIAGFPKLEMIQKLFNGKIQVLLITNNKVKDILPLFNNSPTIKTTTLPFVLEDTILHSLFHHSAEPFQVWIDTLGIVKMKTNGFNATYSNILDLIDGKELSVQQQNELFDWTANATHQSLLYEGEGRQSKHLQYSSIIMNHIPGILSTVSGIMTDSVTNKTIGLQYINFPVLDLYAESFNFQFNGGALRTIMEIPFPESYIQPMDLSLLDGWKQKNMFCYESRIMSAIAWDCSMDDRLAKLKLIMKKDLENYFGIVGNIEKRKMECFVLIRNSKEAKFKSSGGQEIFERPKSGWVFRNVPIETLRYMIERYNTSINRSPVLNETGYDGKIDIQINCELNLVKDLKESLNQVGLDLKIQQREVDVLVLRRSPLY